MGAPRARYRKDNSAPAWKKKAPPPPQLQDEQRPANLDDHQSS